jgi:hypothetical protein
LPVTASPQFTPEISTSHPYPNAVSPTDDSMRYLLATLIAACSIFTVDFVEDADQAAWAESVASFAAFNDVNGKMSSERVEPDNADILRGVLPSAASEHEAAPAGGETSVADDLDAGSARANERAPVLLEQVCEAIRSAAEENGLPIGFFARLLWQESRFKAEEISSAGAIGIAQFMPQTAAEMGLSDPLDPLQAIPASAKFLRRLHDQFGNLGLAAAAYNAGGGRIEKWLSRRGPLPPETRAYVKIITGNQAEDWTAKSKMISLATALPRQAPCDGIGGLSGSRRQVAELPVTLTSSVSEMLRKAEADEAQARLNAARLALRHPTKGRARLLSLIAAARSGNGKLTLAARRPETARLGRRPMVRLASASSR